MIYLDVTGACLLPLQSGIPRTTRGLWQLLREKEGEVTPVFWQPFRGCYTWLSPRARQLLEGSVLPGSVPRDSTWPLLWASFCDLRFWPEEVPLARLMKAEDTLLLTSLFPDNRLGYLRRLIGRPGRKVAIFHDAIPLRDANVAGWERTRHLEMLRLLARLDLVVTVSRFAEEDLKTLWQENGIAATTAMALPWPVPFTMPRPPFSESLSGVKRVLYVSRLKQVKNHATLFDACEKLWKEGISFELELIGCEDEARESREIRRRIEILQKEGRPISWHAQVSEEELHRAYQGSRFTVFPSLMEGFGLPVVESLWHGKPVICSGRDAVGELARQGGCLTVEVADANALADGLRELLEDDVQCRALAREAYTRPARSWIDYGRELLPLLEKR